MAWGVKYRCQFKDFQNNRTSKVDILKDGYGGGITTLNGDFNPFSKRNNESRWVIGTEVIFGFITSQSSLSSLDADFLSSTYKEFKLKYYADGSTCEFTGWIKPENTTRDEHSLNPVYQISATDGIGDLKDIDYDNSGVVWTDSVSILTSIKRALNLTGIDDNDFFIQCNIYETVLMTSVENLFKEVDHDSRRFNNVEDGETKPLKAYEVLEECVKGSYCKLFQDEGYWKIVNNQEYDSYRTTYNWSDLAVLNARAVNDRSVDVNSFKPYDSDWSLSKIEPVKKLRITFRNKNLGDSEILNGDFSDGLTGWTNGGWDTFVDGGGYLRTVSTNNDTNYFKRTSTFNIASYDEGDLLEIKFKVNLVSIAHVSGNFKPSIYPIVVTPSGDVAVGQEVVYEGNWITLTFKHKIEEIGSYNVKFYMEPYSEISACEYHWDDVEIIHKRESQNVTKDTVYVFENAEGAYREDEVETLFGDSLQNSDAGALKVGGALTTSWSRYGKGETETLLQLLGQQIINDKQSFANRYDVEILDSGNVVHFGTVLLYKTKYYQFESFDKSASENKVSGTIIEIDNSDASITTSVQGLTSVDGDSQGSASGEALTVHSHLLAEGATNVTATAAEVNLLDLAGMSVGDVLVATGAASANWQPLKLDDLAAPSGNVLFNMANKQIKFNFTAPAAADGAMELDVSGDFSGDVLHIHQHTGNPGAGTHLIHLEADDSDVIPLYISGSGTYDADIAKGIRVNTEGTWDGDVFEPGNDRVIIGSSISIGTGTPPTYPVLIGYGTSITDSSHYAISIGYQAVGDSDNVVSIGRESQANYSLSVAIGREAIAGNSSVIAIGYLAGNLLSGSGSAGLNSVQIGREANYFTGAEDIGGNTVTIGYQTKNQGLSSTVVGALAEAEATLECVYGNLAGSLSGGFGSHGANSTSIGYAANFQTGTYNIGIGSVAVGSLSASESNYSIAIGTSAGRHLGATTYGLEAISIGYNSNGYAYNIGQRSIALGSSAIATASNSVSIGYEAGKTSGTKNTYSVSIGSGANQGTADIGQSSVAIGNSAISPKTGSISLGYKAGNTSGTVGNYTISIGYQANEGTANIGINSVAIGYAAESIGGNGLAIGPNASAAGIQGIAIGSAAIANVQDAFAIGDGAGSTSGTVGSYAMSIGYHTNQGSNNAGSYSIALGTQVDSTAYRAITISSYGSAVAVNSIANSFKIFINSNTVPSLSLFADTDNQLKLDGPVVLKEYTVAQAQALTEANHTGALVYISDETGGAVPAFSDGTDWRRVTDRTVIST